jgi:NACHT conflict system protein
VKRPKGLEADFAAVRALVDDSPKLVDLVDRVFSAALILSPVVLGPAAVPLLALFDMKSDLIRHAGDLVRKITGRRDDFLDRGRSLAAAHFFITYTAFFTAMESALGEFLGSVRLTDEQRADVIQRGRALGTEVISAGRPALNYASLPPVSLPHPSASFRDEADQRLKMYQQMSDTLLGLLRDIGVQVPEHALDGLADAAVRYYFAQYLDLMLDFGDFFRWAMLYEASKTQDMVAQAAEEVSLAQAALADVDLGLTALRAAVDRLAPAAGNTDAEAVAAELATVYREAVDEKVIRDSYAQDDGRPTLTYPSKIEAFVPQAYKVIRYAGREVNLENEGVWAAQPSRDDLGGYLVSHFASPYSAESVLLVLGHPGSGKSLLTELIAARLAAPVFNTVRLELRDIDPDADIQGQIEEQIRIDTGNDVNWVEYAKALAGNPPLIILDGYDELLQATGKVFAGYLDKVHRFQAREALLKRPVRIMVTSRVTLIDKATIPPGTTVLRLLEFDQVRRDRWVELWNETNADYFERTSIQRFAVPAREQLLDLAQQPLLLLMLAIYDAEANELRRSELDQTLLYDSLLRRFIRRERAKGEAGTVFEALPSARQKAMLDQDLGRLGVAAIGMFNRLSLHILQAELDQDIKYFKLGREIEVTGGEALSQADLLLGSFFFIHESRSRTGRPGGAAAFEFLHNTFGEFLTADFVVRQLLEQAGVVSALRTHEVLRSKLDESLAAPHDYWFASLSFTALHTRPIVLSMIRQWLPHRAEALGLDRDEVVSALQMVITRQLRDVLSDTPPVWFTTRLRGTPFSRFSYLGHLANYTLNLVLLGAMISTDGFEFEIGPDVRGEYSDSPWLRLVHLWRSWFVPESLVGVAAMIRCEVAEAKITVHALDDVSFTTNRSRVEILAMQGRAFGDDITQVLATLVLAEQRGIAADRLAALKPVAARARLELRDVIDARLAKLDAPRAFERGDWINRVIQGRGDLPFPQWALAAYELANAQEGSDAVAEISTGIGPDSLAFLTGLSRYQAQQVVRLKSVREPRWLDDMFGRLFSDPDVVGYPIANLLAALLSEARRARVILPPWSLFRELLSGRVLGQPDVAGLVELRLFIRSHALGGDAESWVEGALIDTVSSWRDLRDVPENSLVALIHLVGGQPSKALLRQHLGRLAELALHGVGGAHFGLLLAGVTLLPRDQLDRFMRDRRMRWSNRYIDHRQFCVLAIMRSARLRDDPGLAAKLVDSPIERLVEVFGRGIFHDPDVARTALSAQQLDDLRWFVGKAFGTGVLRQLPGLRDDRK